MVSGVTEIWELEEIKKLYKVYYQCPRCGRIETYDGDVCAKCLVIDSVPVKMIKKPDIETPRSEEDQEHDPFDNLFWLYAKYGYDYP